MFETTTLPIVLLTANVANNVATEVWFNCAKMNEVNAQLNHAFDDHC